MKPKRQLGLSLRERFFRHAKAAKNGCIEWQSGKNAAGYGVFMRNPKTILAHRMAYVLEHGEVKKYAVIMHICDNPSCVNVAHLRLASHYENQADKWAKNRGPNGSRHYRAKLTEQQVLEIRASGLLQKELAKIYGVGRAHISTIQNRKNWTHI